MIDFNSNMGLVNSVYNRNFKGYSYIKEDLMQCGYLGLWKACGKFDETKKTKFSTFAIICIKNEMLMYLRKEKPHMNDVELTEMLEEESTDFEQNEIHKRLASEHTVDIARSKCRHPEIIQLLLDGYTITEISGIINMNNIYIGRQLKNKIKKSTFCEVEHII